MRSKRPWTYYPITTRELVVLRTADVTPGMRRVTLGGPGLSAHTAPSGQPVAAFRSDGFDDEFKLFLRHPEAETALVPTQLEGVLDWPRHPHLVSRTYTVRRWDPEAGEVDVDLVLHGDGPAAEWARTVRPGAPIQVAGPKMSGEHPAEVDWCLITADETGLPAVGRWLEEFPADGRAQVFLEVAEDSHRQELRQPPGVEITWLVRDGAPAGTTTLLLDAVRAAGWWPGTVFAWAAGEALTLAPIRRWLRRVRQLDKEQLDITGYWRRPPEPAQVAPPATPAEAPPSAGAGSDTAPDRGDAPDVDLHEATELVRPVTLRVAATIGLGELLAGEPRSTEEIVAATGCDRIGTAKLLRYLVALDLVEVSGPQADPRHRWAAPVRGELGDDWMVDQLRLDSPDGLRLLGILALLPALRTGQGTDPVELWRPLGLATDDTGRDRTVARLAAEDEEAGYLADPLVRSDFLADYRSLRVSGRGAAEVARTLRRLRTDVAVRVLVEPAEAAVLAAELEGLGVVVEADGVANPAIAEVDAHLWVDLVDRFRDEEAIQTLRRSRTAIDGDVLLVGESLLDEALDEHECEADLVGHSLGEAGLRTAAERDQLVGRAGLTVHRSGTVGWGYDVRVLR